MTQRTPRERFLPKQGGFETRPYKPPDLCMRRAAALSPSAQALFDHLAAPAIRSRSGTCVVQFP
jgi:hypothetical protein